MYGCVYVCMYVCMYVYMYVCMYVRMYVCLYGVGIQLLTQGPWRGCYKQFTCDATPHAHAMLCVCIYIFTDIYVDIYIYRLYVYIYIPYTETCSRLQLGVNITSTRGYIVLSSHSRNTPFALFRNIVSSSHVLIEHVLFGRATVS